MSKYLEQRHKVPDAEDVVLHEVLEIVDVLHGLIERMVVQLLLQWGNPSTESVDGRLGKVGREGLSVRSHGGKDEQGVGNWYQAPPYIGIN